MHTFRPGEWYLRYTCVQCGSKEVLFHDLSEGKAKLKGTYIVTCTKCGNRAAYETESLERYHHPKDAEIVVSD